MKQRDDTNKQTQPAVTDTQRQSRDLLKFIYRWTLLCDATPLQMERYSLSFAHIGPDAPWQIKF